MEKEEACSLDGSSGSATSSVAEVPFNGWQAANNLTDGEVGQFCHAAKCPRGEVRVARWMDDSHPSVRPASALAIIRPAADKRTAARLHFLRAHGARIATMMQARTATAAVWNFRSRRDLPRRHDLASNQRSPDMFRHLLYPFLPYRSLAFRFSSSVRSPFPVGWSFGCTAFGLPGTAFRSTAKSCS